MRKAYIVWIIIASALILCGSILFGGVMTMLDWDFTKLSTTKYVTNEHILDDSFSDITISTDTADIEFIASDDGNVRVICHEEVNAYHSVSVDGGELIIKLKDERKWYEHIGIGFGISKITVYMPAGEYASLCVSGNTGDIYVPESFSFGDATVSLSTGDVSFFAEKCKNVSVSTSTGSINAKGIECQSLSLSVSTGKVTASEIRCSKSFFVNVSTGVTELSDIECESFLSEGSTGDLKAKGLICKESLSAERSTGDVLLEGCDGGDVKITTDTGDVRGTLLSDKVFITSSDTGKISVPKTTSGGKCEITTDTGDIRITIE